MFISPLGGIMFQIVPMMIFLIFMMVFGIIIFRIVSGAKEWKNNNDSPVLSVSAKVVAKRTDVHHHHHVNEQMHHSSSTNYYVTFEVESGDRMEMKMKGNQYGMLVEGDRGQLTFQGTRYLEFKRNSKG